MSSGIFKQIRLSAILLGSVLTAGTGGYSLLSGGHYSLLDCFYMTVITILTIGFNEVIDSSNHPEIRIFTIFIAFSGIGIATFIISTFTALIVEGQIKQTFKKTRTKRLIRKMENHYIICGAGRVGSVIIEELKGGGKEFVVVDSRADVIKDIQDKHPDIVILEGDASTDEVLVNAGIMNAAGIFATTGDDNQNLVISLTSKYLNPHVRVVARCLEAVNSNKIKKAGADSVINENNIAAMRLASEMLKPTVLNFIDRMFSGKDNSVIVEEVKIDEKDSGKKLADLGFGGFPNTLLLAVVGGDDQWTYNPKDEHIIKPGSRMVIITVPEERPLLKEQLE